MGIELKNVDNITVRGKGMPIAKTLGADEKIIHIPLVY